MRRKIKFPLIMKDGIEVRNIEGLRENFDLEKIINYYVEGKLQRWLQDRNYDNELTQILDLDEKSINLNQELCSIFDVTYEECAMDMDIEKIIETNNKINKLNQYTDDKCWIEKIDHIMFDQDDLDNRLILINQYNNLSLEGKTKIGIFEKHHSKLFKDSRYRMYLCGDKFNVSDKCENVEYIGVNNPDVNISSSDEVFDADERNILFSNVRISSNKNITLKLKNIGESSIDESKVNIKNKIDVKYNKTIVRAGCVGSLIVLDEDGKIHLLGNFINGENRIPKNLPKIVDIDAALATVIALDENGKVHQWGKSAFFKSVPDDLPEIKQVIVNEDMAIALGENGKIYYWGAHNCGWRFKEMPNIMSKIIQIDNWGPIIAALDEDGKIYTWGSENSKVNNIPLDLPPIKKIVLHSDNILALDEDGKIHHWGENRLGEGEIPKNLPKIVDICRNKLSALDENGKIHIWGKDADWYKSRIEGIQKLPKLQFVFEHGGVDENGKAHGSIRKGSTREYTELDNIKIMHPIR